MGRDATLTGWAVEQLGSVTRTSSGTTPARALSDRYYRGGSVAWVKTMDLANTEIHETSERVTDLALKETSLTVYPTGTVLVAMYGGFQQIGRTGILRTPAAVNQAITAIQSNADRLTPEYLLATLNYRVDYWRSVASSSRKDPNITGNDVRAFPIALPTVEEQQKIGLALSDVDALLAGLDRLITKKRDLKQAAMQQLLTGQARLPGFLGTWDRVELGDVAAIRNTKVIAASMPSDTPCVELESLSQGSGRLLGWTESRVASTKYRFEKGDVLFGRLRAYLRKYWLATFDGICSTEIWPLVAHGERLTAEFLHLLVQTDKFVEAAGISYGTHMPRSDWSVLRKLDVLLPPADEQAAIAGVISRMDAELLLLEARRAKTLALKQAMMQELLTGRIRLI